LAHCWGNEESNVEKTQVTKTYIAFASMGSPQLRDITAFRHAHQLVLKHVMDSTLAPQGFLTPCGHREHRLLPW